MLNIPWPLQLALIAGALVFLVIIFVLLKKKKLNVQYSILWLAAAIVLLILAIWPYPLAVVSNWLNFVMPSNLIFSILFVFVLLLLLTLSIIVTGFSERIKRLAQTQSLLEERIRMLENQQKSDEDQPKDNGDSAVQ